MLPQLKPRPPRRIDRALSLDAAVAAAIQRLGPSKPLTLVVNDPQRATATAAVLTELAGGARCRALIATGSHHYTQTRRRQHEEQLRAALPFEDIAWHDCRDPDLVEIAGPVAWHGRRWLLDESHALLAIGSCEPHYFAGITGAHKTLTIGCAAYETIQANHHHALSEQARPGRLEGNPVHEGIAAMADGLLARREALVINLLQLGQQVIAAVCGPPLAALKQLAPLVRAAYFCPIPRPADALVLKVEGVLGRSFYQADKGLKNSEWAVRDGGLLVLQAPCPDGIGQDDFLRLLHDYPTYDSILPAVGRGGYRLGDHKAVKLRYLTDRRGVRVFVVSKGLSASDAALLGFAKADSVESALAAGGIDLARDAVYQVADAGNTCVVVA